MALADILKKVIQEAEAQAGTLHEVADTQLQALTTEQEAETAEAVKALTAKQADVVSTLERKAQGLMGKAVKEGALALQHRVLDTALNGVVKHLSTLSGEPQVELFKKLMSLLPAGSLKIITSSAFEDVVKKTAPSTAEVTVDANAPAGFKVQSGKMGIDLSFESLVKSQFKDKILDYVTQSLSLHG